MTVALLDVNVLLALLDSDHADHRRARSWLEQEIEQGWSSCVLTENGFVRILSQPRYPNPVTPWKAMELLRAATKTPSHERWPCDISLLDTDTFVSNRVHGSRQVTDVYLLGLAVHHGGRLVTFDQSIPLSAVRGATADHLLVL